MFLKQIFSFPYPFKIIFQNTITHRKHFRKIEIAYKGNGFTSIKIPLNKYTKLIKENKRNIFLLKGFSQQIQNTI